MTRHRPAVQAKTMRTLIAFDGSEHALRAVEFLCQHPHILGDRAEVTVVFVASPTPLRVVVALGGEVLSPLPVEAERAARPALDALRQAGIEPSVTELTGDPGLEISQLARDGNYDLVVMGSHGHGLLNRALLGSVVNKLLAHCTAPVLIVR